jgi:hypothetical protein
MPVGHVSHGTHADALEQSEASSNCFRKTNVHRLRTIARWNLAYSSFELHNANFRGTERLSGAAQAAQCETGGLAPFRYFHSRIPLPYQAISGSITLPPNWLSCLKRPA